MDKLFTIAKYIGVIPVMFMGWGFIVSLVHFSEQVSLILEVVTIENVRKYDDRMTFLDAMIEEYKEEVRNRE